MSVTPLDAPSPDPIGLLPPHVTGLPRGLWSASAQDLLVTLVQAERIQSLPAMQRLTMTLMLAEAAPPMGAGPDGTLFLARVDKLLDYGAIDEARGLLEQADIEEPELFRRWFDVALLTGTEDRACDVLQANPQIAPTYSARIFCLARSGQWPTAALTLNTRRALGDVTTEEEALLSRFLDVELFENEPKLPPPSRISPLVFRMREAIGEGIPTAGLPRAFAHADLRQTIGWKSQLEAAERLVRAGALDKNVLAGFYLARRPSASGGVWDRARAMQAFDAALQSKDVDAVAKTLAGAWNAAQTARIEVAFANLYGARLNALPVTETAWDTAIEIGLLSPDYEAIARDPEAPSPDQFLTSLARGAPENAAQADPARLAVQAGFGDVDPPPALVALVDDGKLGEALLRNIALFNSGLSGDFHAVSQALALFRMVGLEGVARRAALEFLILERAR